MHFLASELLLDKGWFVVQSMVMYQYTGFTLRVFYCAFEPVA